mmetsp:Transcript_27042/g.33541  ORF Transcript_27042/g.33541 Transcript_27042/m.33541 type:complete len:83 (-) Transcript_27042:361-609(-)
MSHVALVVLLAVDKCTLMERDSLCAEWAIQILNLATFMTFKSSDEGLPGLAPLWYESAAGAPSILPIALSLTALVDGASLVN